MSLRPDEVAAMRRNEARFGRQLISGAGCPSGKRVWHSKAQAKRALKHAKAAQQTKGDRRVVQSIYECRHCGGWHMTKQPQRRAA